MNCYHKPKDHLKNTKYICDGSTSELRSFIQCLNAGQI